MRGTLRRLHRWLAIACAMLWLSQAVTGLAMVYRWELDDASIRAPVVPLDPQALGAAITALEHGPPARKVTSLWASGGVEGRYDLYVDSADGSSQVLRVDGAGRLLRTRPDEGAFVAEGWIPKAADLHQTLLAGDAGHLVVGVSGLILLSSLVMGTVLAWPPHGQVRAALLPKRARPGAARRYAWHRALGLWLALPAIVMVSVGVMLVFYDPLERALGEDGTPVELQSVPALTSVPIAPALAMTTALQRFPGSQLSGVSFPGDDQPWYRIRVLQPGEWRRVYGTTTIYVAAADGRVLLAQDPLRASLGRRFLDNLYPVHTGEAGGVAGRIVALSVAAWLLAMLVLGLGLWWIRRR